MTEIKQIYCHTVNYTLEQKIEANASDSQQNPRALPSRTVVYNVPHNEGVLMSL